MFVPKFLFYFMLAGVLIAAHPEQTLWLIAIIVAIRLSKIR